MSDTSLRPFPYDFATRVNEGAIVHFCYQALCVDPATGEYICVLGKTKDASLHGLRSLGVQEDQIVEAHIQQVAMMSPSAIRTRSGALCASEPNPPIQRKPIPRAALDVLQEDDLI